MRTSGGAIEVEGDYIRPSHPHKSKVDNNFIDKNTSNDGAAPRTLELETPTGVTRRTPLRQFRDIAHWNSEPENPARIRPAPDLLPLTSCSSFRREASL